MRKVECEVSPNRLCVLTFGSWPAVLFLEAGSMGSGGGESLEDLLLWESTLSLTQNPRALCFPAVMGILFEL